MLYLPAGVECHYPGESLGKLTEQTTTSLRDFGRKLWFLLSWIGSWPLGHWMRASTGEERGERREKGVDIV